MLYKGRPGSTCQIICYKYMSLEKEDHVSLPEIGFWQPLVSQQSDLQMKPFSASQGPIRKQTNLQTTEAMKTLAVTS